ncbi:hypothetical protein OCGS_0521 [Oceaniovalibus guishaninsula JLT2003]|uniref:YMGG-like Gly-zipper domain-containing protein n=1 Tax=Oceaniovalibus guishaninsula JLT2003 TaxID=1231392 RepID=K2GS19_9RHOB|nr:hypothetical protein [Oceaniovalibus guishaninsula]EKE45431.1 hypothetical protein OCGS_0521 [Oceaniovalibus guishaninsula JLT2003]
MSMKLFLIGALSAVTLTACGNTPLERGATGAVAGGVVGEAVFDEPLAGAAVGGAAGALTN